MEYKCKECGIILSKKKLFCSKYCGQIKWAREHPEAIKAKRLKFRSTNYGKFVDQRQAARQRKIQWDLSYEDWVNWWGEDIKDRHGASGLMMLRYNDEGPYAMHNIYKGTASDNIRDMHASIKRKKAAL